MTAPSTTRRGSATRSPGSSSGVSVSRSAPVASIWIRGAFAAAWAVLVALASLVVLSLIVWAADPQSTASAPGVTRFAGQLWLLALRDPLRVAGGSLVIPPLALTALLALLLARATAIVARSEQLHHDGRGFATVVGAVTGPFAVLATIVAAVDRGGALRPTPGGAFVCAAVLGGVASAAGAAWGGGLVGPAWRGLAADARTALEAAAAGGVVILCAAALLVLGSLIAHASQVGTIVTSYRGGAGQFSMLLLSVLYLPNAMIFAAAYIVGPGFAVGAGTSVTVGGAHLGAAPAFPLLAALPSGPAPIIVRLFCGLALVGAGAAAGWRIVRREPQRSGTSPRPQLRVVALTAGIAGVATAAVTAYAGGPAGPGRLRAVGPSPWQSGLLAALELGVVAGLVVLGAYWQRSRRRVIELLDRADQRDVVDVR